MAHCGFEAVEGWPCSRERLAGGQIVDCCGVGSVLFAMKSFGLLTLPCRERLGSAAGGVEPTRRTAPGGSAQLGRGDFELVLRGLLGGGGTAVSGDDHAVEGDWQTEYESGSSGRWTISSPWASGRTASTARRGWRAEDWEQLVIFYAFPKEHWKHRRTTNVVESALAAVRLRAPAAKQFKKVENTTGVIWKTLLVADQSFRCLDTPELLREVAEGVEYVRRRAHGAGQQEGQHILCWAVCRLAKAHVDRRRASWAVQRIDGKRIYGVVPYAPCCLWAVSDKPLGLCRISRFTFPAIPVPCR